MNEDFLLCRASPVTQRPKLCRGEREIMATSNRANRQPIPAWGDENAAEAWDATQHSRELREKAERAHKIKCDHLRERVWQAVNMGDDDSILNIRVGSESPPAWGVGLI